MEKTDGFSLPLSSLSRESAAQTTSGDWLELTIPLVPGFRWFQNGASGKVNMLVFVVIK